MARDIGDGEMRETRARGLFQGLQLCRATQPQRVNDEDAPEEVNWEGCIVNNGRVGVLEGAQTVWPNCE